MARKQDEFRVNQLTLASELGLTDRRIRQMVTDHLLPAPNDDGKFDLELCRARYDLFRNGSDRDWDDFFESTEDQATNAEKLLDRALADGATAADCKSASLAIQTLHSAMMFITAAKSKTDSERQLFFQIHRERGDRAMAALLYRVAEIAGYHSLRIDTGEIIPLTAQAAANLPKPRNTQNASRPSPRKK